MKTTLGNALIEQGGRSKDVVYLIDAFSKGQYRTFTFGEVLNFVRRGASWSQEKIPAEAPSCFGLLSENSSFWMLAYYSVGFAGGVVVPLDVKQSESDISGIISDSGLQCLLVSPTFVDFAQRLKDRKVIQFFQVLDENWYRQVLGYAPMEESPASAEKPASIIYTSGTTGAPKGAVLTHQCLMNQALQNIGPGLLAPSQEIPEPRLLAILPLNHIFIFVGTLSAMAAGSAVVFTDSMKPARVIEILKSEKVTHLAGIPLLFDAFLKGVVSKAASRGRLMKLVFLFLLKTGWIFYRLGLGSVGRLVFGFVRRELGPHICSFFCGGAKGRRETIRGFLAMGYNFQEGYGLTETAGGLIINPVNKKKVGSVGKPFGDTEVRIADPSSTGEGEVCIRGKSLFAGYFKHPEITANVMDSEGWFHTGDLGRLDRDGYLWITGRAKEIIVLSSGKKVSPEELEFHYSQSPLIEEVAALGVSEGDIEKIFLIVVPSMAAIKDHVGAELEIALRKELEKLSSKLAPYKRPQGLRLRLEPLPRTSTRKIRRREVEAWLKKSQPAFLKETGSLRQQRASQTMSLLDHEVMNSHTMGVILAACLRVLENPIDQSLLTPSSHLSMDLGLDSIMLLEAASLIEIDLGVSFSSEQLSSVQTLSDFYELAEERISEGKTEPDGAEHGKVEWLQGFRESVEKISPVAVEERLGRQWIFERIASMDFALVKVFGKVVYRLKGHQLQKLPASGPFILAPNHVSYLDYPALMGTLPPAIRRQAHIIGKQELASNPVGKVLCWIHRMIPVDRAGDISPALLSGAKVLKQGRVLVMYPEGTRSVTGKIQPLKRGIALLSQELQIPVVPVYIQGTYTIYPPGARLPRLLRLKGLRRYSINVTYGDPIPPGEAVLALTESFMRSHETSSGV